MKIKGAIFDLDGTLLDTMPFWEDLGAEYLRQKGYTPPKNINETLKTMSLDQGASYLKKTCSLPESEEVIVREIISLIEDLYRFRVPLKAHVVPFLQRLSENRVKMCIATATDHALAKAALERLEVIEYFQFIFTCREAGLGKDQPEFFLKVLERLKTPKRETLVFEDALHAIKSAKAAGFPVVAVYDGSSTREQAEIAASADLYLNSFAEWEKIASKFLLP